MTERETGDMVPAARVDEKTHDVRDRTDESEPLNEVVTAGAEPPLLLANDSPAYALVPETQSTDPGTSRRRGGAINGSRGRCCGLHDPPTGQGAERAVASLSGAVGARSASPRAKQCANGSAGAIAGWDGRRALRAGPDR